MFYWLLKKICVGGFFEFEWIGVEDLFGAGRVDCGRVFWYGIG